MTRITALCVAFVFGLCMSAAPAKAQSVRTFVSAESGNDADDCSRLSPCRTLAGTLAKTQAAGEITVLDAGTYGSVTIGKAISIFFSSFPKSPAPGSERTVS